MASMQARRMSISMVEMIVCGSGAEAFTRPGATSVARIASSATTTISSTSVKARCS